MNFLGHAASARRTHDHPGFLFGAMVPDFAGMVRSRPPATDDARVAAGIRHHHAVDRVFHDLPEVRRLMASAFADLSARGVRRGPARAAAHVGVELLIDAALAADDALRSAYLQALSAPLATPNLLRWPEEAGARAFFALRSALVDRGVHPSDGSPDRITYRLGRAFAGRPRLAPTASELDTIGAWSYTAREAVAAATDDILDAVDSGLVTA